MRTEFGEATVTLVRMTCWCGMPHAIPRSLANEHDRAGTACHCPLGHSYIPSDKGENARLKRELQEAQDAVARAEAATRRERDSHAATRGQLTKTKNRLAHGVCPCCKRHFTNLERHMKGQHPDFQEAV